MNLRQRFAKKKRKRMPADLNLQITSLADVLMIVLIFLLKSISAGLTDSQSINVTKGIRLPGVLSGGAGKEGIKVEVSEDRVELAGQRAATLYSFRFGTGDLNGDLAASSTAKSLNSAFGAYRKMTPPDSPGASTIWIVADRRAPYATIQTVVASAAMQGYQDFKLAVVQGE